MATPDGQITVRLALATLEQIDQLVNNGRKTDPFVKRTDVVRALLDEAIQARKKARR